MQPSPQVPIKHLRGSYCCNSFPLCCTDHFFCGLSYCRPKLKNVDRSSAEHKAVTVNNVTVIITEFQPKRHLSSSSSENNHHSQHPHHPLHHHHHHHQPPHYGPLPGGGVGSGEVGLMATVHGNMNSHPTHNGCNGAVGSTSSGSGVENGNHSDSTNCSSNDSQSEGRSSWSTNFSTLQRTWMTCVTSVGLGMLSSFSVFLPLPFHIFFVLFCPWLGVLRVKGGANGTRLPPWQCHVTWTIDLISSSHE